MPLVKPVLTALTISFSGLAIAPNTLAQAPIEVSAVTLPSGDFVKKRKTLKGSWEMVQRGEKTLIVFGEDFKASGGPDLKVFLSPADLSTVTGKTAINGAINIGELKKTRGAQEYELPQGIELADYKSVLVHCEAYAVLWGGGAL